LTPAPAAEVAGWLDLDSPPPPTATSARLEEILDRAEEVVEAEGLDALTMRRLAVAVGIRAPSLYKHVADKAELEARLQERGLLQMGAALRSAGSEPAAMAAAYRRFALEHPGMYTLATAGRLARDRIGPGVEDWSAAPVVALAAGDEHRARLLWAAAHGLVVLELAERFPPGADLDAAWAELVDRLT
jgi:AcrR family transcriptional regulator